MIKTKVSVNEIALTLMGLMLAIPARSAAPVLLALIAALVAMRVVSTMMRPRGSRLVLVLNGQSDSCDFTIAEVLAK